MFGGLCFMVNGKMCAGVESARMMVGFDTVLMDEVFEKEGVTPMDFPKKIMKGYAFVYIAVPDSKKKLACRIDLAPAYNKVTKASKKKK